MTVSSLARAVALLTLVAGPLRAQDPAEWPQHSLTRPKPPVVTPGAALATLAPPSDAIVLFDGSSLAAWERAGDTRGLPAGWRIVDGALEVVPGSGGIATRQHFGEVQLHVEWRTPNPPIGSGQNRGNSGVFLMGQYEVQVLDSWENPTYADGQAAAIYGQFPPLVNASRRPGVWQSFDIIFRRPIFDAAGKLAVPARMTILHNGILVHQDAILLGPTSHTVRAPYESHPDQLPIQLQDHGTAVQFRNIWVRPLRPEGK